MHDLGALGHLPRLDPRPGRREDPRHAVVAGVAVRDLGIEPLVQLEGLRPAAAGRVDVDALVVRDQHELRRLVEERTGEELLLPQHPEGGLAGLRVRHLGELGRQGVDVRRVVARAGQLAEVDLPLRGEAVRARPAEVDVGEEAVFSWTRQEREQVERAAVPRQRSHELLVNPREIVEPPAPPRLQRPLAEVEMTALLEPAVEMEHPVDRLHPVVGEEEDGRLLAVLRLGGLDQLAAERVDALVDLQELVARAGRRVRGVLRVEARVAEVADVVGAHEVDAEEAEVRLELEDELADAGHLLGVLEQPARVGGKVLPPALRHRVVRGHEIGKVGKDPLLGARRQDLRPFRAAVAGDDDPVQRLRRIRERDADVRRANPGRSEQAPERRSRPARRALELLRPAVRVRREVEDPVPAGTEPGEEGRPGRRREGRVRRAERPERPLAGEAGDRRQATLSHQPPDEVVVGAVERQREDSHRPTTSR